MATSPQDLLQRGIAAARAGQNDAARQLLAKAIQMDPRNEQAWLWLSSVARDDAERVRILQQLIQINPHNEYAIKGLQALGAMPGAEPAPQPPPEEAAPAASPRAEAVAPPAEEEAAYGSPVSSAPPPPAPEGIPLVETNILSFAQQAADSVIREILQERREVRFDVNWVPTRKRFRRRRALNPLMVAGILGGLIALAAVSYGIYSFATSERAQRVALFVPSPTPTITLTPTGTPTLTPQPSPTVTLAPDEPTFTPEATIAFNVPHADLAFGLPSPTPPYFATPHQDNPRLRDAIQKYREGDYEAVIEEIPIAREAGPDLPDSYFFEGMSYAYLGQYERAAAVINDGLGQGPDVAPLHAALGYVLYKQGEIEESRSENETAKVLDPALIMPYLTLAEDYREAGLYEEALFEVEEALRLDAHNVETLVAQGEIYMAQGRPDSAAAIGNLGIYIDPTAQSAVLLLGRARIALEQYGQAVKPLEDYLGRVNQAAPDVWILLGQARYLEGSREQALDAFSKAILLAEDSTAVLIQRGDLFLETGDYQDAFTDFDQALSQADSTEAHFGRAQAAVEIGRYGVALDDIEIVLQETPFDPQARLIHAKALVETGRYNESLDDLNPLLAAGFEDPADLAEAHEYRGRAEYFLRLYGDAIFDMEQALSIEETGTRHYYRGLALEATNNVSAASLEYDWVLFWDRLYAYPFTESVTERLDNLREGGSPQGAETFDLPAGTEGETSASTG